MKYVLATHGKGKYLIISQNLKGYFIVYVTFGKIIAKGLTWTQANYEMNQRLAYD